MKIHTAVLNQQRLFSPLFLQPLPSSLPPYKLSGFPHRCQGGDVVSLKLFFPTCLLKPFFESSALKEELNKATAGANRLLSKLEVNSEGATVHSEPFDPTLPCVGTTEEEMDKMDDRPPQRGQVQGQGEKRRRRWWECVRGFQFVGARSI